MTIEKQKAVIEAVLFATGNEVKQEQLMSILEISAIDLEKIIALMKDDYKERGIDIIRINNSYQLSTKKEYAEYVVQVLDNRSKPSLSPVALETLAIIAYNPKITKVGLESIRGVNTDGTVYKLLEYGLIEESGKCDLPGKPMGYVTTSKFLKMFGITNLNELPELPKYKLNENEQIVLADLEEFKNEGEE
jgi:segregation and condensation protein B